MSRGEQFAGWASAVLSKMFEATKEHTHGDSLDLGSEEAQQAMLQVVARAGYDLACHVVRNVDPAWENPKLKFIEDTDEIVSDIPDMAVLPEDNNTSTD